jgi:hypothetical protein
MKSAIYLGGSEAREALQKLESHILAASGQDAELQKAIQASTDSENIVDILVKLNPGVEAAAETKTLENPTPESDAAEVAPTEGAAEVAPTEGAAEALSTTETENAPA